MDASNREFAPAYQSQYPELVPGEQLRYPELVVAEKLNFSAVESDKQTWAGSDIPEAVPNQFLDWQNKDKSEGTVTCHGKNPKQDQIGGISRRLFWIIICATLVAVIGAVVGITVSLLVRRETSEQGAGSTSTNITPTSTAPPSHMPTAITNILSNSSLSAINFTDPSGYKHRMVFFEDGYNAIVARRWDEQNRTWTTSNISLVLSNSPTPVNIALGAALAAAGINTQVDLFLVDAGGMIRSLYNNDVISTPDLWQNYTMNDTLWVYPQSRLSATVQSCDNRTIENKCPCYRDFCHGGWLLAFQRPDDGAIITTNYTSAWAGRQTALDGRNVTPATSLELITQYRGNPGIVGILSQRYVSGTVGAVQVAEYENHAWDPWHQPTIMTDIPVPAASEYIVASKWRDWSTMLSYVLSSNGALRGIWWDDNSNTTLGPIRFDGGPDNINFTTIAMADDAILYGISGDEMLEFSVDDSDPSLLHYVGKIFPP